MLLKKWDEYVELVALAYEKAPNFIPEHVKYWKVLNDSNYQWFEKIINKIDVIFVSGNPEWDNKKIKINLPSKGLKDFRGQYLKGGQPYNTQIEMNQDVNTTNSIKISIDYSLK